MDFGNLVSKILQKKESEYVRLGKFIKSLHGVQKVEMGIAREIHGFPFDAEQLSQYLQKAGFKETFRIYKKDVESKTGLEYDSDLINLKNDRLGIGVSITYDSEDDNVISEYKISKGDEWHKDGEWKITLINLSKENYPNRGGENRLIRYKIERSHLKSASIRAKPIPPFPK